MTHPITSQPTEQEPPIAELILPSIADTTLSNAFPDDNFRNWKQSQSTGGVPTAAMIDSTL
jgi:hypothetical protein